MSERGSMSVFTVLFSVVVFLLAGLLVDGGSAINARLRAADVAEQAARAGADQIDVDQLRTSGETRLLGEDQVCARADEIVEAQGGDDVTRGDCAVGQGGEQVTVTVSVRWEAFFLSAIGFPGAEMAGTATAAPEAR
ncbi:TadE/TadG family type IV pilus assembly protein [Nonomuraea jiangxiensis]|uniref:Putative Flp pilus-assembly TadE/G-like n=1 Tax=Nonomuraea jiangxiensis TaxID=633440 RepID=A0A1G8FG68_9ACTN|nr:flp pilus-assembly TadE/G-like family protein [Nonomuraea jiangxiensis]SDH80999.1 Putative Flp pilus-assembly TadE/G-like [Nonomuraea jiangxiensis]